MKDVVASVSRTQPSLYIRIQPSAPKIKNPTAHAHREQQLAGNILCRLGRWLEHDQPHACSILSPSILYTAGFEFGTRLRSTHLLQVPAMPWHLLPRSQNMTDSCIWHVYQRARFVAKVSDRHMLGRWLPRTRTSCVQRDFVSVPSQSK